MKNKDRIKELECEIQRLKLEEYKSKIPKKEMSALKKEYEYFRYKKEYEVNITLPIKMKMNGPEMCFDETASGIAPMFYDGDYKDTISEWSEPEYLYDMIYDKADKQINNIMKDHKKLWIEFFKKFKAICKKYNADIKQEIQLTDWWAEF